MLDKIWRKLSYSLLLLIGLVVVFSQPIDHGQGFAAKGGMRALAVVELDPSAERGDADAGSAQLVGPDKGRELRTLIGVHDLWRAEAGDSLLQCLVPLPDRRFATQICREGQNSASSVFEMRQANTLRVCQSMIATRYRTLRRIGKYR
ncbi:hypothetical protein AKJ29_10225 [Aliiroseovarius crassostreae]|uniref:Uncharacterized protein n=1 Tax=Aliiroseovarius crassostreae TaxID=154981 RepID=A0A0P7KGV7_9RHOB|nr:hypothetical protein AKJ29_10225 [Aliiroseovarius crassostreae]